MSVNIFYAWQSDLPNKTNRGFIEDALNKAVKALAQEATLEPANRGDEIRIDKDTQGVAGSPPIVDTIFDKISECALFVPDLSFVGQGQNERQLPNPNVLIEYGYAIAKLGYNRVIPVMNTAFGDSGQNNENMPFDMRHLRNPIMYCLPDDADESERKNIKADLVKQLKNHIDLAIKDHLKVTVADEPVIDVRAAITQADDYLTKMEAEAREGLIKEDLAILMQAMPLIEPEDSLDVFSETVTNVWTDMESYTDDGFWMFVHNTVDPPSPTINGIEGLHQYNDFATKVTFWMAAFHRNGYCSAISRLPVKTITGLDALPYFDFHDARASMWAFCKLCNRLTSALHFHSPYLLRLKMVNIKDVAMVAGDGNCERWQDKPELVFDDMIKEEGDSYLSIANKWLQLLYNAYARNDAPQYNITE